MQYFHKFRYFWNFDPSKNLINVRERNFGRPSTIWQSHTSSIKGPLEGFRQACRRSKLTKRNLSRFNRCSTGAIARLAASARSPVPRYQNLKHSNTFLIDAPQALETSSTCARTKFSDQCFGLRCRGLLPKVFISKIFNRTFLLILKGSRRDLASEEVLASVRFSSTPSINLLWMP